MDIVLLRRSIRAFAEINFSRSGGPGGQNVNKLNTKATLHIKLSLVEGLSEAERSRLCETLNREELVISSSEERYQRINLERAYAKAEALITAYARLPKKRKASRPSAAARENRLKLKRLNSEKKHNRKTVYTE